MRGRGGGGGGPRINADAAADNAGSSEAMCRGMSKAGRTILRWECGSPAGNLGRSALNYRGSLSSF